MAIRSLTRGGGAANKPVIDQFKELEKKFRDLQIAGSGEQAKALINSAAKDMFDRVVSSAQAANVPHDAQRDIFYSTKQKADKRQISGLVGLRKRGRGDSAHGYRVWFAGRQRGIFGKTARTKRSRKALVVPKSGRKIGENLGTMWEVGTTKHAARPFFRTAIEAGKGPMSEKLITGYKKIIAAFAQ